MRLGYWGADNLDNEYCGKDGGTHWRHPLFHELNQRGHSIHVSGPDPGNYDYTEEALVNLGILEEAYRFRDSLDFVVDQRDREWPWDYKFEYFDALIVELRSEEFIDEHNQMCHVIRDAIDKDVPVFGFDRNNWGRHLDELKHKVHLIRPYRADAEGEWRTETFLPYWVSDYWPRCNITPKYDLVYVGNRWGREDQMGAFLDIVEGRDILVAGNWPMREQEMVERYAEVDFIGPTPHFATVPLLQLGRATFHVGKPDYHDIGFYTVRFNEAYEAGRFCMVWHEHEHSDWIEPFLVEDSSDVDEMFKRQWNYQYRYTDILNKWRVKDAANVIEKLVQVV